MLCRLTAFLLAFSLTGVAAAQTAKPANPIKIGLEVMVVTVAVDAQQGRIEADLIRDITSAVKSNESEPWSTLQSAVDRMLPKQKDSVAAAVDAYALHTFPDLEQRVNFATVFAGGQDPRRGGGMQHSAQTKVTATPWVLDEERFGLGVTVLSEVPVMLAGIHSPREREQTEMTSNTLVNNNEASVILSRSHTDAHGRTLLLVIVRVSR
ncbi:hypothetical protein [Bremerella alba]|uniref:Uncharacterized protein n=1 Tax=Bremerella alba TaxID=980252 RepID=A0A7V9A9E2_9BACT|nr:hypothetical protein [Bremerella alba]MBA2117263.1 hypothetical protein [Bremerella alba]